METTQEKVKKFLSGYSGKELIKKHEITEKGFWSIYGEDPNCDFGGSHHQPNLGVLEGTLSNVISYAVNMKQFWSWGGGGSISKVEVINVDLPNYLKFSDLKIGEYIELITNDQKMKGRIYALGNNNVIVTDYWWCEGDPVGYRSNSLVTFKNPKNILHIEKF